MIGKILKTMRKKAGLSQSQVSKLVGFARNTISQYETGVLQPDFETINKIAQVCGYEIEFINKKDNDVLTSENIDREEI